MYQSTSYTNAGLTSAQSVALNTIQHITILTPTIPIITNAPIVIKQIESIPDAPISYETSAILVGNVIHTNLPTATLFNSEINDEPSDGAVVYSSAQPFQLVGAGGSGGSGGLTISTFNDLHTSSFSVSTIQYNSPYTIIGLNAGSALIDASKDLSVVIGAYAGGNADLIGNSDGLVAIGAGAMASPFPNITKSVAIGLWAGGNGMNDQSVAIGWQAGYSTMGTRAIAIGAAAGYYQQQQNSIAIGAAAGIDNQQQNSIAIGCDAGISTLGANSIAIGYFAGGINHPVPAYTTILNATGSALDAIALQTSSFYVAPIRNSAHGTLSTLAYNPGTKEITYTDSISQQISTFNQLYTSVATVSSINFSLSSIAIGGGASVANNGINGCVAIGENAKAGQNGVAIGAGTTQMNDGVAIGEGAQGISSLNDGAVSIGAFAGWSNVGYCSVGVGFNAGFVNQGSNNVAVGQFAQWSTSGANSIAIGAYAGKYDQPANTIILNATGLSTNIQTSGTNSLYIDPIRNTVAGTLSTLVYNPTTKEISYTVAGGGGGGIAGGSEGSIQYNSTNTFYGNSGFIYDNSKDRLNVPRLAVLGATTTVGVTSYTNTQLNTNLKLGDPTLYTNFPDMILYPATAVIGTLANPATSISMASVGSINLSAGTGVSLSGGGITISGAFGITAIGGTISLGAGAITMGGGAVTMGAGAITFTGGGITMGAGYITMASGALTVVSGAVVIGSGAILMGSSGILDGTGILSYGGDLSFHKGLLGTGGNGFFDVSVQTSSMLTSTIAINKTATLGNFGDATSKVNRMTIYGTHETYGSGIFLSNVSGNSKGAGLFGNYITSLDDITNTLGINNVSYVFNSANTLEIDGLSTVNGAPFGTFSTLNVSSIQGGNITLGTHSDSAGVGAKMIVYGANSGSGGIYLSSISGNAIGAGLYTNIISPANGSGTLLNITGVQNIENSNLQMRLVGVSTMNGNRMNPTLFSEFSSLGASSGAFSTCSVSSITAESELSKKVYTSSINASTIVMATDGKITTNFLNCSSISTQSIQSYNQSELYSLYLPSSGVIASYNIPSGSAVFGGGMYLGNPPYFTNPASGSLTMTGNLDATAVGSQIRVGGQGITVADGGSVVLTQQAGNGGVYVSSMFGTAFMNSGNVYANAGVLSSLTVSSINTGLISTSYINASTLGANTGYISSLYVSSLTGGTITSSIRVLGDLTASNIIGSGYVSSASVNTGVLGADNVFADFIYSGRTYPGSGTFDAGDIQCAHGMTVGTYPPTKSGNGNLWVQNNIKLLGSGQIYAGEGGFLTDQGGSYTVTQQGQNGGVYVNSATYGNVALNSGEVRANIGIFSTINASTFNAPTSFISSLNSIEVRANTGVFSTINASSFNAPTSFISSLGCINFSTSFGYISSLNVSSLDCRNFSTSYGTISSLSVSSINGLAPGGSAPAFYFANSNFTGGSPSSAPAITNTFGAFLTQNINLTTASSYTVNATATVFTNGSGSNIYAGIFVNSVFYGASTIATDTTIGTPNQQGFMTLSANYANTFPGSGAQTVDLQLYTDGTNSGDYTFLNGAMNIITGLSVGV